MKYLKLTDEKINLATSYQKWQQEKYGNILLPEGMTNKNPNERQEIEDRRNETKLLIENENLNGRHF